MKMSTKEMVLVSLFAGLTAIGAFISLPVGPVPITLQTLFVLLSGFIIGAKLGALSQIVYIILGLIGLPIFAGFTGGFQSVLRPSFGFLIGFIAASYVVGKTVEVSTPIRIWVASILGTIVIYVCGLPYMYYILNNIMGLDLSINSVLNMGLLMFLPGDIIKLIVASIVGMKLKQNLKWME